MADGETATQLTNNAATTGKKDTSPRSADCLGVPRSRGLQSTPVRSNCRRGGVFGEVGEVVYGTSTEPWKITANVSGKEFKIDKGADVSVLPSHLYDFAKMGKMEKSAKILLGPGQTPICSLGK